MSNIQAFIEFWQQNETASKYTNDSARLLWEAHKRAVAQLHAAEAETLRFLRPIRGNKGSLAPGFHPGSEGEVTAIADRITDAEKQISTIAAEIEEFCELAGGPSLLPIQAEVDKEKGIIGAAIVEARKVRATEERRIRGQKTGRLAVQSEIAASPLVQAAEEKEAAVLAAHEGKADALRERSVRAYSICAKHDHRTAI